MLSIISVVSVGTIIGITSFSKNEGFKHYPIKETIENELLIPLKEENSESKILASFKSDDSKAKVATEKKETQGLEKELTEQIPIEERVPSLNLGLIAMAGTQKNTVIPLAVAEAYFTDSVIITPETNDTDLEKYKERLSRAKVNFNYKFKKRKGVVTFVQVDLKIKTEENSHNVMYSTDEFEAGKFIKIRWKTGKNGLATDIQVVDQDHVEKCQKHHKKCNDHAKSCHNDRSDSESTIKIDLENMKIHFGENTIDLENISEDTLEELDMTDYISILNSVEDIDGISEDLEKALLDVKNIIIDLSDDKKSSVNE
jgi:hypothetical protein